METVEKWRKPLIRLHLRFGTNCGRIRPDIHNPVEKIPFSYIFALPVADSCLPAMHTLHIFSPKGRDFGVMSVLLFRRILVYPQTHNLWITFPVDGQTSPKSRFFLLWRRVLHRFSTRGGDEGGEMGGVYMGE